MPSSSPTVPARSARYSHTAIALHWLLAAALTALFALGLYMADLPFSPQRLKLYNWHKWAGVAILALSLLRLLWRLTHRAPPLPAAVAQAMPAWQKWAHHGTHHLMYLLFFAVPLIGWAYSSAAGFPIVFLGVGAVARFRARQQGTGRSHPALAPDQRLRAGGAGRAARRGGAQAPVDRPRRPACAHVARPALNHWPRALSEPFSCSRVFP